MSFQLQKAERAQAKLRVGVNGPSGSGKTYSALLLAYGITNDWSKIVVIDTENNSASLYAHLGEFNTLNLDAPYSPERYIEAIKACEDAGMEVIIIDSTSHEWEGSGGCLQINEKLAATKFRGNTWSAWSETTPRHQNFIHAITASKAHVITCTRNKIDTVMTEDKKVKKVGTKEIQREGFEYEITLNFNIDRDTHHAIVSKDRTNLFESQDPFIITTETGKQLVEWAQSGKPVEQPAKVVHKSYTKSDVADLTRSLFPSITNEEIKNKIIELTNLDPSTEDPTVVYKALAEVGPKVIID